MRRWGLWLVFFGLTSAWACGSVPSAPPRGRAPAGSAPRTAGVPTTRDLPGAPVGDRAVNLARSLLGAPYRYAGADPSGFDCSGLTAYVFSKLGQRLPRTARDQAAAGRWVAPDELSAGDLVFFGDDRIKPYHVGLVVSRAGEPLTMIHSSSSRGVIETAILTDSYWLSRLSFGRRVLAGE